MNINGFTPVIFSITPVTNLPALLGLNDEDENVPAGREVQNYSKSAVLKQRFLPG